MSEENNKEENKNQLDKVKEKLKKKPQFPKNSFNIYWIYGLLIVAIFAINIFGFGSKATETSYPVFEKTMLKKHHVDSIVVVNGEEVEVYIKRDSLDLPQYEKLGKRSFASNTSGPHYVFKIVSVETFMSNLNQAQEDFPPNEPRIYPGKSSRSSWNDYFAILFPIILMILLMVFFARRMSGGAGGQLFNIGKSKATLFDKNTNVNITFNDVAGLEEAKVEIMEIVEFLKTPKKYTALGAKIPKGALLVGPPGTGKTLLAKAVAGEAKVPFFSLSGSDFVEMFVGVGASRVRDLFRQAKEKAPCIIFIDEIDAIGRARGRSVSHGANDERENTLNQLLTEMDGFGTNSGVIILAATNRADVLDRALLRPGRFDRQIYVDMPDLNERKDIFKVHLKPLKIDATVDVNFLAKQTPGFSGADIANICNEAALIAARGDKKVVGRQDFLDAVDRVIGGLEKKNKIISAEEKKVIAYHEAGHAAVSWLLEHAHPLVKVTIVPRGKSLGAAWYLPEERQITTTEQMFDEVCASLGGRAAEEVVFGKISTGALSDLEKITKQAYAMITYYGLNEKVGNVSFYDSTGQTEYAFTKPYSEKTAQIIDEEVSKFIEKAYLHTKEILMQNKSKLTKLAEALLEKEVIFKEDLEGIFGARPYDKIEVKGDEKKEVGNINHPHHEVISNKTTPEVPENGTPQPEIKSNNEEKKQEDPLDANQEKPLTLF